MKIFLVALILFFGFGIFFIFLRKPQSANTPAIMATQATNEVEASEVSEPKDVHSIDGKLNLTMEKESVGDSSTYTFYTSETEADEKTEIFTKTLDSNSSLDISPNAWSPDGRYIFITQKNPEDFDYYVLRADGDDIVEGKKFIDVVEVFNTKETGDTLSQVTGWDSPNLLHIFTKNESNKPGPSFWFEVPSGWTSQLAHK